MMSVHGPESAESEEYEIGMSHTTHSPSGTQGVVDR
jgi:hypothetical protein